VSSLSLFLSYIHPLFDSVRFVFLVLVSLAISFLYLG
jgi:hypothetical protein